MSAELQIRSANLAHVVGHAVRKQLRGTCLPPITNKSVPPQTIAFIGHIDVLSDSVSVTPDIDVHVPVNVFIVTDAAVRAAPNSVPAGVNTPGPPLTLAFSLQLTLSDTKTPDGTIVTKSVLSLLPLEPNPGQCRRRRAEPATSAAWPVPRTIGGECRARADRRFASHRAHSRLCTEPGFRRGALRRHDASPRTRRARPHARHRHLRRTDRHDRGFRRVGCRRSSGTYRGVSRKLRPARGAITDSSIQGPIENRGIVEQTSVQGCLLE
jgi:hypothetical protein